MSSSKRTTALAALGVASVLGVSACGGGGTTGGTTPGSGAAGGAQKGGTIYWLTKRPAEHMDPQRTYIGRDIFNQQRLVYRGLLQFPAGKSGADAIVAHRRRGHRRGQERRRRQEVDVHDQGRREVGGRQAHHV